MGIQVIFGILNTLAQLSSGGQSQPATPQIPAAVPAQEVRAYCSATGNMAKQVVAAKNAGWTVDMIVDQLGQDVELSDAERNTLTMTVRYVYRDFSEPQQAANTIRSSCASLFRQHQTQYPQR